LVKSLIRLPLETLLVLEMETPQRNSQAKGRNAGSLEGWFGGQPKAVPLREVRTKSRKTGSAGSRRLFPYAEFAKEGAKQEALIKEPPKTLQRGAKRR
jgi:hypothetical protein